MSGGSYDYVSFRIEDAAGGLRSRHPSDALLLALASHLTGLAKILHDIEWADSGDTTWTPELREQVRAFLAPGAELSEARNLAEVAMAQLRDVLGGGR